MSGKKVSVEERIGYPVTNDFTTLGVATEEAFDAGC